MSQFSIPVEVQAKFKENPALMNQFVKEVAQGTEAARAEFLKLTNQKYKVEMVAEFDNSGNVTSKLKKTNAAIDGLAGAWKKETKTQKGSVTQLTKRLSNLKQQQNAIRRIDEVTGKVNKRWLVYSRRIQETTKQLDMQKGGINGVLAKMGSVGSVAKGIIPIFGKIGAMAQVIQQLGIVFEGINMAVGKFVSRQKAIQGFQLAMEGFGLSVEQSNGLLSAATGISLKYGANLQSVEKGLKRITPTLVSMGGTAEDAEAVMSAMSARVATLGLNSEQSGRYMEAFAQVMGKGKLQSEELNQQFAELDGSLRPAAEEFVRAEYGIQNLDKAMRNGEVSAGMFAEAIVAASREMQENLEGSLKGVQDKIGKFNIQQLQSVMDTLNTKAIEEVGRQFEAVGRVAMSVQVTFTQFWASIVTQGKTSGEFVSATLAVIGGALAFIGDVAMLTVKGILSIIEVLMRMGKAIGEFLGNIPGLKQAFGAIGKAAEWTAAAWGKVKDVAFQNNIEVKEANKTLTLTGKTLKEYTVELNGAAGGTSSMGKATANLNPLVTEYVNELMAAGSVTAEMSAEVYDLVQSMSAQSTALADLINLAQQMGNGLSSQVDEVASLATSFDRAGMSEAAFMAQAEGVQSSLNSQTTALQKNLNNLRERKAAGEQLNKADAESLRSLPGLISKYREMSAELKNAKEEGKAYAASKRDATIAAKEFASQVANEISSLKDAVGTTGAFSREERELAKAAGDASDKIMGQVKHLNDTNAAMIKAAGGANGLTMAQKDQVAKNADLATTLTATAQKYEELATESTRVTTASGDLNPALAKSIAKFQSMSGEVGTSKDQLGLLATQGAALQQLISGELNAAMSSYNTLVEKQILNNGMLSKADSDRLNTLKSTITELNNANAKVNEAISANSALSAEVRTVQTVFEEMRTALANTTIDMNASIVTAGNLVNNLAGVTGASGNTAGALSRLGLTAGQAKSSIDAQISSLQGYVQNLVNAKLAGFGLTTAQQAMVEQADALITKLKETKNAIKNVADATDNAAKKSGTWTLFPKRTYERSLQNLTAASKSTIAEVQKLRTALQQAEQAGDPTMIKKYSVELSIAEDRADNAAGKLNSLAETLTNMKDSFDIVAGASYDSSAAFKDVRGRAQEVNAEMKLLRESIDKASSSSDGLSRATGDVSNQMDGLTTASRDATEQLNLQAKALSMIADTADKEVSPSLQRLNGLMAAANGPVDSFTSAMDEASKASDRLAKAEKAVNMLRAAGSVVPVELVRELSEATTAAYTAERNLAKAITERDAAQKAATAEKGRQKELIETELKLQETMKTEEGRLELLRDEVLRHTNIAKARAEVVKNIKKQMKEEMDAATSKAELARITKDYEMKLKSATTALSQQQGELRNATTAYDAAAAALKNKASAARDAADADNDLEEASEKVATQHVAVIETVKKSEEATESLSAAQEELRNRSEKLKNADPYVRMAENARNALRAVDGLSRVEMIGDVKVYEKFTMNLGPALNEATKEAMKLTDVFEMSKEIQKQGLTVALESGEISKKKFNKETAMLESQSDALQRLTEAGISRYGRELKDVERVFRRKELMHAMEMTAFRAQMASLQEQRAFEESFAQMLQERISAEQQAMEARIQTAKRSYDEQFKQADLLQQREKIAHDQRMSKLNFELEKVRQIANERISELEKLTPAEEKLARLREKELRSRAKDSSLSSRERLEAKAALERLEANKKIAKEQERIKEIEDQITEEVNKRKLSELELAKNKANAEAAYQRQVLKFQQIYESRVKDLIDYQLKQRMRMFKFDDLMRTNALDQMGSRERQQEDRRAYDDARKRLAESLDDSLDAIAASTSNAVANMGENLEQLTEKTGSEVLEGLSDKQNDIAEVADLMYKSSRAHALEVGQIQLSTMRQLVQISKSAGIGASAGIGTSSLSRPSGALGPSRFSGTRASGGPVSGGSLYQVNELGKEGFLSSNGSLKEINAPAFGSWRAPGSGTVIPAHIWSEVKASKAPSVAPASSFVGNGTRSNEAALVAALASLSGGSKDTINNNVTIQSATPVQTASDMLVQMTKIRNRRMR